MNPTITTNNIPTEYNTPQVQNFTQALRARQAPVVPVPQINAANLLGQSPLNIPQAPVNTVASGIIAGVGQGAVDYRAAAQRAEEAQASAGNRGAEALGEITRMAGDITGQKSDVLANQANIENQLGIQEQQKVLGDLNNEIANQTVAFRAEQDKIRNTPMSKEQAQIKSNEIEDTYGRRLADLAIRQSAAQGNVQAIQNNAERQTKLLLAPLDNRLEYLRTYAKDNADALSKKDSEKLSLILGDVENQRQQVQNLQKAKTDYITLIAEEGAGTDQQLIQAIQRASTPEEVASLAANSGYLGRLDRQLKQAQIANIYSSMDKRGSTAAENKKAEAQIQLNQLLNQYRNTISGLNFFTANAPSNKAAIQSLKGQITAVYKQAQQLGTLDAGVQKLIDSIIPDPSNLSVSSLSNASQLAAIDNFIMNQGGAVQGGVFTVKTGDGKQVNLAAFETK